MSERPVIDALRFARGRERLRGAVPVAELGRLEDLLAGRAGEVSYEVAGELDPRGRPFLHLRVQAEVELECQRCLGAFAHEVRVESTLYLAVDAGELPEAADEPDDVEWVVAADVSEVTDLVEQEIVLALPYSPAHPPGACPAPVPVARDVPAQSPFARLAVLKTERAD